MRSLAHTVPSRLVIPFGVWFSFNFGNTLFNLLFRFGSDSHSRCHSSCSKSLILFPKSEATIVFDVLHKNAPEYLVELLPNTVGAITSYNLRNDYDFDLFDLHSEKFRKSLLPDCVREWNSLDEKREMKVHMIHSKRIQQILLSVLAYLYWYLEI